MAKDKDLQDIDDNRGRIVLKHKNNLRNVWRHLGQMLTYTALGSSTLIIAGARFTYARELTWLEGIVLFICHFLLTLLLVLFLWWPLITYRKAWRTRKRTVYVALSFATVLTPFLTLIFPRQPLVEFMGLGLWGKIWIHIVLLGFNFAGAVIFFATLGSFWWQRSLGRKTSAGPHVPIDPTFYPHFRPRYFLGGMSFFIGLYFVGVFEFWAVNVLCTVSHEHVLKHPSSAENDMGNHPRHSAAALRRGDFFPNLDLVKFLQPYYHSFNITESLPQDSLRLFHLLPHRVVEQISLTSPWKASVAVLAHTESLTSFFADAQPTQSSSRPENEFITIHIEHALPLLSVALAGAFILFLFAVVPLRVLAFVLPPVWHDANDYNKRLQNANIYTGQFYWAVLAANPLVAITGGFAVLFLIVMPIFLVMANQHEHLDKLVGPDQLIFVVTLVAAWISPIAVAGIQVDRTYGGYFNTRLSNLILGMRRHMIFLGYGDLGRRIVDRELNRLEKSGRINWYDEVVSPDLHVEKLCISFIIVERNADYFLFSATNDFLGTYGVVAAAEQPEQPGKYVPVPGSPFIRHTPLKHIFVPVVCGNATEPYTLSRVNLERASFLISMVSEDERIHDVFKRATEAGLQSVICVSRSDQIFYITHKAADYPVWLVYPKQNQGAALGQRLFAAVLKCRTQLRPGRTMPYIMVVGSNKSSQFMLENLWLNWPGTNDDERVALFEKSIRFVPTTTVEHVTLPDPAANAPDTQFNRLWPSSYVFTARHHIFPGQSRSKADANIRTRIMLADESGTLERCCREFEPDIMVINDDSAEKSRMLLLRALNALERIKYIQPNFRLPLLLMGSARGDEEEKKAMGDAMRYYDGMRKLYEAPLTSSYPRLSSFRRKPLPRRLIGDSINDSVADTEEIIAGIYENISSAKRGEAFELNSCLPNNAGTLAVLTARLAGLNFTEAVDVTIVDDFERNGSAKILRPSFQYLRHIKLEVSEGYSFSFTGFAELQADDLAELRVETEDMQRAAIAMRVFASDGRNYLIKEAVKSDEAPPVPELLRRIAGKGDGPLTAPEFIDALHGSTIADGHQGTEVRSEKMCPAMTICPIASYQSYILATNGEAIHQFWQDRRSDKHIAPAVEAAPYYHCAKVPVHSKALLTEKDKFPLYARLFCCCHGKKNDPGLIAVALNTLVFQAVKDLRDRTEREKKLHTDWVANIAYFKDLACQNRLFSLNRLFGTRSYTREILKDYDHRFDEYERAMKNLLPIRLLQIMPVGDDIVARQWFVYAVVLYNHLTRLVQQKYDGHAPQKYRFVWWDQNEQRHEESSLPPYCEFYPIVIQIEYIPSETERGAQKTDKACPYCECSNFTEGCAQNRPWG